MIVISPHRGVTATALPVQLQHQALWRPCFSDGLLPWYTDLTHTCRPYLMALPHVRLRGHTNCFGPGQRPVCRFFATGTCNASYTCPVTVARNSRWTKIFSRWRRQRCHAVALSSEHSLHNHCLRKACLPEQSRCCRRTATSGSSFN